MSKECHVCALEVKKLFSSCILHKYQVNYFLCGHCGFLQTEKPYWLEEAYSNAIADSDTGLVYRNINFAKKTSSLLYLMGLDNQGVLDCAGGTGMFVRLMRDIGFNCYWEDPYCDNIHARGFSFSESDGSAVIVTAFEVLEHLEYPVQFIKDSLDRSDANTFIFSTELYTSKPPPKPESWAYFALDTGQHISFYCKGTLEVIASLLEMNLYTNGYFHMLTKRKVMSPCFQLATSRASSFLSFWVNLKMKSKTLSDSKLLLKRRRTS